MSTLYTVGYGNRKPGEFLRLLKDAGITLVIDIRRSGSKSWCGKYHQGESMEAWLHENGLKYSDHPELANSFSTLAAYQAWLETKDGGLTSSSLYAIIEVLWQDEVVCLVCAEKYPYRDGKPMCHRVLLANELLEDFGKGWHVSHIVNGKKISCPEIMEYPEVK
jgi:uncharacterized protein (DUF488 family)